MRNDAVMKKTIKYNTENNDNQLIVTEPFTFYEMHAPATKKEVILKDFTFSEFKKIADQATFTLKEWADFLHTSERTLQRYAKDNSSFNGLQIERILLFKKLIKEGNKQFGKEKFGTWINRKLFSLNFKTPREFLFTHDGVQEVINILGRLEHGIVA